MAALIFLIIPVAAVFLSMAILRDVNSDFIANGLPSLTDICGPSSEWSELVAADSDFKAACQELGWIEFMQTAGAGIAVVTIIVFLVIWGLAKLAGTDRSRNALVFPILVPATLLFIVASVLVQGALVTFALYEAQVQFLGSWYPIVTAGIGIGAIVVALSVISSTSKITKKLEMVQRGIILDDKESPLWKLVEQTASDIDAPIPKNLVVGLEPNFYATAAAVNALSSQRTVSGETLYISAPLMRLLTIGELKAVIGHELGHFKGADSAYALKFAPVYRALNNALEGAGRHESLMAIPAIGSIQFLLNTFEKNEKAISREREFEADKAGASAASPEELVSALVKLNVFGGVWGHLIRQVISNIDLGRPVENMSTLYAASVAYDIDDSAARDAAAESASSKTAHPTDTHPTLQERMTSLQIDKSSLESINLAMPEVAGASLLPNLDELEKHLTGDEQQFYIRAGAASFECRKPDGENVFLAAQLIETAAAAMVCADGKIEIAEIERSESLGIEMVPHFNSLCFRQKCLAPNDLPSQEELSNLINSFDSAELKTQIVGLLEAIAKSDGEIAPEEQAFINRLTAV